jgi:apolipoprotein N-acyltransferase
MWKWILAVLSGLLLFFSWGRDGFSVFFVFISLFPLFVAEHKYATTRFAKYFLGLVSLFIFHLTAGMPLISDVGTSIVLSWLALDAVLLSVPWAVYVLVKKGNGLLLALGSLIVSWLSVEQLSLMTGVPVPWFQVGNGLAGRTGLIQFYEYTGVAGGTLWILSVNCALFYSVVSWPTLTHTCIRFVYSLVPAIFFLAPILLSSQLTFNHKTTAEQVVVVNTRQRSDDLLKSTFNELLGTTSTSLSKKVKYIVWPESIFDLPVPGRNIQNSKLVVEARKLMIQEGATVFICGLLLSEDNKCYNTAVIIDADSIRIYQKKRLVPFTEYTPFIFSHFTNGPSLHITPAKKPTPETNSISVNICYESLFGWLVSETVRLSKGRVIALISNEAWTPGASELLLNFSALRAIENRKFVLRSTNNGIGSIITPEGKIQRLAEDGKSISTLIADIYPNNYETVYMKYGDVIGWSAVSSLALLPLLLRRKSRKISPSPEALS